MGKLVLIDGNAVLHRAFHALPPLTTRRGEPINAVYGLVSMLLRVITDLKPTHIAVCFDEKEKTFRHLALETYQAQRPPTHEDLSSQFAKARNFLGAAKIPVYSKIGYEADDVIGTLATRADGNVVIITGDRDQLQLVNDKIKLYMPIAGLANAKLFGEAETIERMGVPPSQIADLKSLMGDASDNYFGVPGIGPKTAISLLSKYKSKTEIYKHLKELPENLREKLENGRKSADLSYKLATIVRNVPVEINFDKMTDWKIDSREVLDLFQEFGFKTLTERVKSVSKKLDVEKQMSLL